MISSAKYLLLGGGYTLAKLASRLNPDEFVITTTNSSKLNAFQRLGYRAILADLTQPDSLAEVFREHPGIETVIDSVPPQPDNSRVIEESVRAMKSAGVLRLIYLSTTGVYGCEDGSWVDEESDLRPNNPRSCERAKAEQLYAASGLQATILRIAAIYGPGRGIGTALKEKRYRMLEDGNRWSNRIHVDDLVATLQKALSVPLDTKIPAVLCLADCRPELTRTIVEYYCKTYGLSWPQTVSTTEAGRGQMHSLASNQRVDNRQLLKFLGAPLKYPSYIEGSSSEFE